MIIRSVRQPFTLLGIGLLIVASHPRPSLAADKPAVSFKRDIAPIFVQQCQTCHGAEKTKGGYRLDSFDRLRTSGSSGDPALSPGKPEQSQLFKLLISADADERMPKKADPLPKEQIALVKAWIDQGATFDGPDPAASLASYVETAHDSAPLVYRRPIPIAALAFVPDGASLLAGGAHELTRWDAKTGKLLDRIPIPVQRVQGISVSSTGALAAVVGGTPGVSGALVLVDLEKKSEPKILERTADLMPSIRFSPDGKLLAAGGADGTVRVYEIATGKKLWKLEPHADWVTDLSFSPDGTLLATASRDKSCRVFEVKSGQAEGSYLDHGEAVFAVAFASDGKTVYSGGRDRRLHTWLAMEGKPMGSTSGFAGEILRIVIAGNQIFTASSDGKVREHAADRSIEPPKPATQPTTKPAGEKKKSDKPLGRLLVLERSCAGEWVYAIAVGKDGQLAAGTQDGKVRIWTADDKGSDIEFIAAPGYGAKRK